MKLYVATHLKDMNRKVVYRLMESEEILSKTDIAKQTGISAPTVMKIAAYMTEKGILLESGEGNTSLGRKPMLLRFNPDAAYTIGLDYQGDYATIGLVDLKGKLKLSLKEDTGSDFNEYLKNKLKRDINTLIRQSKVDRSKVLALGIGVPGAVDSENNIIHFAPLIGLYEKTDISSQVKELSGEIGMPVYIENDVNAAAVGEYVARGKRGHDDVVYITIGTKGVGAGIIMDGKLRKGIRFSAGEVGYMVFERGFNTSKTRGGWLEGQISNDPLCHELVASGYGDINNMDPGMVENAIDHIASFIGLCIANISSVLDIDVFVAGGIIAETLGDRLFDSLDRYIEKYCLNETKIEHKLCKEPTVTGVASIARENELDALLAE